MAFNTIPGNWISVGKALKQMLFQYIKDNFDDLDTRIATVLGNTVPNGSFELIDPSTGEPVNWTINLYAGGSFWVDEEGLMHGRKMLIFISSGGAGNGGGYATSDYQACSPYVNMIVRFLHYSTALLRDLVGVMWYDAGKAPLTGGSAQTIIYDSSVPPSTPAAFAFTVTPPAGAAFCKIRLYGGYNDNPVAGSSMWDNVYAAPAAMPVVASGTRSGLSMSDGTVVYIRTGYMDVTNPGISASPFAYSAMVQAADGGRYSGHNAAFWAAKVEVFVVTGFEVSGPNGVSWQGETWYRGDVGIKVTLDALDFVGGDSVVALSWALTKGLG